MLRQPRHHKYCRYKPQPPFGRPIHQPARSKNAAFLPTLAEHATGEMGKGFLARYRGRPYIPAPTWLGCQHSHVAECCASTCLEVVDVTGTMHEMSKPEPLENGTISSTKENKTYHLKPDTVDNSVHP